MSIPSLLERLSTHRTIGTAPQDQIAWIAEHGVLHHLDSGAVLTSKNGQVEGLHVVLDGHLAIYVDRGAGRRKIMEWRGGDVTGLMPYSRLVAPGSQLTTICSAQHHVENSNQISRAEPLASTCSR